MALPSQSALQRVFAVEVAVAQAVALCAAI